MQEILGDKVSDHIDTKLHTCDAGMSVADAAKEMVSGGQSSVLVLKNDEIAGIVTAADMLKLVAAEMNPATTRLEEIKSHPVIEIDGDASIMDAIGAMTKHGICRLLVKDREPIGMITRKHIIEDVAKQHVEPEAPPQILCPYCESEFAQKEALSKHIDQIHIGKGLLEGNTDKY